MKKNLDDFIGGDDGETTAFPDLNRKTILSSTAAGRGLLALERGFKGDSRFEIDERFADDFDASRINKDLRARIELPEEAEPVGAETDFLAEKNRMLRIMGTIVEDKRVFRRKKFEPVKRFDPSAPKVLPKRQELLKTHSEKIARLEATSKAKASQKAEAGVQDGKLKPKNPRALPPKPLERPQKSQLEPIDGRDQGPKAHQKISKKAKKRLKDLKKGAGQRVGKLEIDFGALKEAAEGNPQEFKLFE